MPTVLPRVQVSQTPPVAHALEVAEREWPGVPRSELIVRLMSRGAAALEAATDERRESRRAALQNTRGTFEYPAGYLDGLRAEWPE